MQTIWKTEEIYLLITSLFTYFSLQKVYVNAGIAAKLHVV